MSHIATHWAMEQTGISPSAKLVLLVLADYHNQTDNMCYPSKAALAKKSCMEERTVQRSITELVDEKLITIEPRYDLNGRQTSNQYALIMGEGRVTNKGGERVTNKTPLEPVTINHTDTSYLADAKKSFWDEAVGILLVMGIADDAAKPLIGKWLRMAGKNEDKVLELLQSALDKAVREIVPWMEAALRNTSVRSQKEKEVADVFEELKALEKANDPDRSSGKDAGTVQLKPHAKPRPVRKNGGGSLKELLAGGAVPVRKPLYRPADEVKVRPDDSGDDF